MLRSLYTAYTGMINEQKRLDVISNNVANAATVGYKSERATSQQFRDELTYRIKDASSAYSKDHIGDMSLGVKIGEVSTDYSQGSLLETGNTYDLAIEGDGFFQVSCRDANGNVKTRYTRNGNFTINKDGFVVDSEGNNLLGDRGAVQVPTDAANVSIDTDGSVFADNVYQGRVILADFEDYDFLEHLDNNMYEPVVGATQRATDAMIHQGFTEQSNVNSVTEMVNLIAVSRAYEAGQKMIQTSDSMMDKAVNEIGVVKG